MGMHADNGSHATGTQASSSRHAVAWAALKMYKMHSILLLRPKSQMLECWPWTASHTRTQACAATPTAALMPKGTTACHQSVSINDLDTPHSAHTNILGWSPHVRWCLWRAPAPCEQLKSSSVTDRQRQHNRQLQREMAGLSHLRNPQHKPDGPPAATDQANHA
jgi:hypothetical protein